MGKEPAVYSEGFKRATIQRVLLSDRRNFREEARKLGILATTVWVGKAKKSYSGEVENVMAM